MPKRKQSERVARLEERLENHITHFGERLTAVEGKLWWIIGLIVGGNLFTYLVNNGPR